MSSNSPQNGKGDAEAVSETASWPFESKNEVNSAEIDEQDAVVRYVPDPGCDRDAEEYNMSHPRRGLALVFNHANFASLDKRSGTNKDCAELAQVLKDLRFSVKDYHDLQYKQLIEQLDQAAAEDHSDADCLLVAVLTHGAHGLLHTKDLPYPVQELWQRFLGDKCPTLAGKPKIFIIQACRGEEVDKGVRVRTQTDSGLYYTIPTHSDILIAYSTVEGHYAWRNSYDGSWFIQALVEELRRNGSKRDLQTLLTFVHRRVAVNKMSVFPNKPSMDQKKQAPAFTSMLTRLLYFR